MGRSSCNSSAVDSCFADAMSRFFISLAYTVNFQTSFIPIIILGIGGGGGGELTFNKIEKDFCGGSRSSTMGVVAAVVVIAV